MQIITTPAIVQSLNKLKMAAPDFISGQFGRQMESQPFLLAYAARREMASELGTNAQDWFPSGEELANHSANAALLSVVTSLLAVVAEFNPEIPLVGPEDIIRREQALTPQIMALGLSKDSTDEQFFEVIAQQCRQRDLLDFAFQLWILSQEEPSADAPPERLGELIGIFLHDMIKMRIVVDTLDEVTEAPAEGADESLN
ncbi:MAG: hypothetical protein N3J91_07720 [Verrucomicrobiae bacterium]|nr:hypothetical protein [Verrucomicrobiae bacterium]